MRHVGMLMMVALALAACDTGFEPREKVATFDAEKGGLVMPYPCPDWSHPQGRNYGNFSHSNYGCAVNTNLAVQLEDPEDLKHGHGVTTPDIETTTGVVGAYRAGEIPQPLTPLQSTGSEQ